MNALFARVLFFLTMDLCGENFSQIDSHATASLRFLPAAKDFFSLSLSLFHRVCNAQRDASKQLSRRFPFPFSRGLLYLPLLPLVGVVFAAGVAVARLRRRETKFRRWRRWEQQQRKPPPLRVSRTRVRRVHGEDQEDQEEVHRCGPNVRQLGRERRVRKEPGVHVRELLLRCVVVIVVVVATIPLSFSLSRFSLSRIISSSFAFTTRGN